MKSKANIHIDKIRVTGLLSHVPIGEIWYLPDPNTGEIRPVASSAENKALYENMGLIYIHSQKVDRDGMATAIVLEFCPGMVFQRHNLFGHSDLLQYVYAAFDRLTRMLGIQVLPEERKAWKAGNVALSVVHLTANFSCPFEYVLKIIDAVDENNRSNKHRDITSQIGLGFTEKERSRYRVLSIYDKWRELKKQFGPNLGTVRKKLLEEAKNTIRVEIKFFWQFLNSHMPKLNTVASWNDIDVDELFFDSLAKYKIQYSIQPTLTVDELRLLSKNELKAYRLWLDGYDIQDQFNSRTTRYKYIRTIKEKVGVDISVWRRPEKLPEIDLAEIFSRENVLPVPDWLKESKYFFSASDD